MEAHNVAMSGDQTARFSADNSLDKKPALQLRGNLNRNYRTVFLTLIPVLPVFAKYSAIEKSQENIFKRFPGDNGS